MDNTLLSVVIPTYNRYQYLKDCLVATASIESDELEIVVHDNTEDNSEILPILSALNDDRIKYFHEKKHISVVENSDRGVAYANGEYICMIGDDDTICESMLQAARFCKLNKIDACMAPLAGFNWPDMTFKDVAEPNLFYTRKGDGSVTELNAKETLEKVVKNGDGLPLEMPRVYHGLVSKKCLERIKEKCGTFFPGPSPDMANAAAVSLESSKTVFISDYLMVSGYGYKSSRGEGNRKEHFGKISEKFWLPSDTEEKWLRDIPKIFSGETIFAQSLLNALNEMGEEDLAAEYNYGSLYAQFLAHHKETVGYMIKFCFVRPRRMLWMISGIVERLKIRKEVLSKTGEKYFAAEANIKTLNEAQNYTNLLRSKLNIGEYYWR